MKSPAEKVKERPAESGGLAGAGALLVARLLGVQDPDTIVALGIVFAAAPAGITWLVGLIRGAD